MADHEATTGNVSRAIEVYEELLRKIPKSNTKLDVAVDLTRVYVAFARLYRGARRIDLASALDARRLELWRQWQVRLPHSSFVRQQLNAANEPFSAP
jgi:hypothetical protein